MNSYAYYNGKFGKRNEISIPLSDRSIFFGDAIYDAAIGSYDRILWEDDHLERFLANARAMGINHEFSKKQIKDLLHEVAIKSMIDCYFIYFQMSRSSPVRNHSANGCNSSILITVDPISINETPKPLKLITAEDLRYGYCNIKTINLLPAVIAMTEAEKAECDEAVFINNNIVTECSKSNISIIKQGRLITHPINNKILPGIARKRLLEICNEISIICEEREFTRDELFSADEVIVSSTTKLCNAVSHINGVRVGSQNSPITKKIHEIMYKEFTDFCIL